MSITRNIEVTINSDTCSLNNSLFFYKNDTGIILNLSIVNLEYNIVRRASRLNLNDFDNVDILISKPNKKTLCLKGLPIIEGKIEFGITENITDVIGDYLFQIRLLGSEGAKITLPPCDYKVLEPIAIY